jgi:hypothetical protein
MVRFGSLNGEVVYLSKKAVDVLESFNGGEATNVHFGGGKKSVVLNQPPDSVHDQLEDDAQGGADVHELKQALWDLALTAATFLKDTPTRKELVQDILRGMSQKALMTLGHEDIDAEDVDAIKAARRHSTP